MLKYCHKTLDTVDTVCVPLDEVITVRHLDNLKKKNVLEIMFPHHSILLSFKSFMIMERWLSELINVASKDINYYSLYIELPCIDYNCNVIFGNGKFDNYFLGKIDKCLNNRKHY